MNINADRWHRIRQAARGGSDAGRASRTSDGSQGWQHGGSIDLNGRENILENISMIILLENILMPFSFFGCVMDLATGAAAVVLLLLYMVVTGRIRDGRQRAAGLLAIYPGKRFKM